MARVAFDDGGATLDVPDDWMQGRSAFGGLQAAFALRAMRAHEPGAPLRTLQATFLAPVGPGPCRVRTAVLRRGQHPVHVEARLVAGDATLALLVGVFGAPRSSDADTALIEPRLDGGDETDVELRYAPGMPAFSQHFAVRWRRGGLPFSGDRGRLHVVDVGLRDEGPVGEGHVVALADFIPPIALAHLGRPAFGSTLTWMLELLDDRLDGLSPDGWRVHAELAFARGGYTSQHVVLAAPDGRPIALGHQSMLVFG
jgi:hypothetical protein